MGKFEETQTQAAQPEVLQPVRAPSTHSDVAVPLEQAVIIGLFVSAPLLVGAYGVGVQLATEQWLAFGFVLFCVVTLAAFLWRMGVVTEGLHRVEEWAGVDFEGDDSIGAHAIVIRAGPNEQRNDPIAQGKALLRRFLEACYAKPDKNGTTVRSLQNAGFTDRQIEFCRDILLRAGVVAWNGRGHKNGLRVLMTKDEAIVATDKLLWNTNGTVQQE